LVQFRAVEVEAPKVYLLVSLDDTGALDDDTDELELGPNEAATVVGHNNEDEGD
jgi:hypothetical protein